MDITLFTSLIHPGQLLFGSAILLFGSAFTLGFLLGSKAPVVKPLTSILFIILFLFLGTVAIEFSNAATPSYTYGSFSSLSQAFSTHRWLLFTLPIILTMTILFVLLVYHEKIADPHARVYRSIILFSLAVSFGSLLTILFESLF